MRTLERKGLITKTTAMAAEIDVLTLYHWDPARADTPPNFQLIATSNKRRWNVPIQATGVAIASEIARTTFGGVTRGDVRRDEIEHDIAVTTRYLQFLSGTRQEGAAWVPEDALNEERFSGKRPDALIRTTMSETIVEVVGRSYRAEKLEDIFNRFAHEKLEFT
ncbi:MAG: hypothetical protein KDB00_05955 [Planctomycetales bacterium]|nr:hypothetical protein [Planctomycetales bacterium]